MNVIIILFLLLLIFSCKKELFNNPKKIISKKKILENYLKEFNCDKFIFYDTHPIYNFHNKEILVLLEPIINNLNKNISTDFYIYEILKASKYIGGYYHVIFSAIDNFFVNNFEIKFKYENKRLKIGMFSLYNSEINNIKGFNNQKLENNKIGLQPNYSWMFDLARGDMGLVPHTGNNRN